MVILYFSIFEPTVDTILIDWQYLAMWWSDSPLFVVYINVFVLTSNYMSSSAHISAAYEYIKSAACIENTYIQSFPSCFTFRRVSRSWKRNFTQACLTAATDVRHSHWSSSLLVECCLPQLEKRPSNSVQQQCSDILPPFCTLIRCLWYEFGSHTRPDVHLLTTNVFLPVLGCLVLIQPCNKSSWLRMP